MRFSRNRMSGLLEREEDHPVEITDFDDRSDLHRAAGDAWPNVTYYGVPIRHSNRDGTSYYALLSDYFPKRRDHHFQVEYVGYRIKKDEFVVGFDNDPEFDPEDLWEDDDPDEEIPVVYRMKWDVKRNKLKILDHMEMWGGTYRYRVRELYKKFKDLAPLRVG